MRFSVMTWKSDNARAGSIFGILDKDRQADQYQMDLLRAATSIPGRAMYMPVVWSNKHLAVCWAPDKVATLDEYPQPFLSCDNTVVVMSSNIGSSVFFQVGLSPEAQKEEVLSQVRATFRPEFLNRIDETIVFHPLGKDEIAGIVDIQLRRLQERLADRKLAIAITPAAREYLSMKGYDPTFGARPLKRLIQREVQDPLAMKLLGGDIREGDAVEVDREGDSLTFRRLEPGETV